MSQDKFQETIAEIDRLNALDPNMESKDGKPVPKELLYGQRMSTMLLDFEQNASETLKIAVRGQHIQRWTIPRESYPMDRKGYLMWRTELKKFHGALVSSIMQKYRYAPEEIQHVEDLINKRRLKTDPEAQCLEDVVCLVFLQYYFDEFIGKHAHEEDKIIDIIRKTWKKMSEKGHAAALKLRHSEKALELVQRALS
ncbi:DUF4202 domain-containing protein [Pararhodonellum marinum]|uniref:DUF4202 domain-containing protein n=1 Tax=Pararhodonellum marinum TaxID=2755358 RepID=UPI00188F1157|nr:DUF4202 domain-containing protein [Pararhodonellum marinum]